MEQPAEADADEQAPPAQADTAQSETDEPAEELSYSHGKWVRFQLFTPAPDKAAAFYAALFGWTSAPTDSGIALTHGAREIARIVRLDTASGVPQGWLSWVSVEDVDDVARDVLANGGSVLEPAHDDDQGRVAIVVGPTGGTFGLIKASAGDDPDDQLQPGDWYWNQLWTTDLDESRQFYEVIGGYTSTEMTYGNTTYAVLEIEQLPRAVIRLSPKGQSSRWIPFVYVDDVRQTTATAKRLKAKVITEPRDVEGMGEVAVYETPTGGLIGAITPAAGED